jgi:hypothetical protein
MKLDTEPRNLEPIRWHDISAREHFPEADVALRVKRF